jgi:hypothetical protein
VHQRRTGARRRTPKQRNDTMNNKGVRALRKVAAPAKRPARLDGRLSSDGGSAQWRDASKKRQTTSSQGSAQPRLDGQVHITVMGVVVLTGALDATTRRWCRGATAEWIQSRAEVAEQGRRQFGLRKGNVAVKRKHERCCPWWVRLLLHSDSSSRERLRPRGPLTGAPSGGLAFRTARRRGGLAAWDAAASGLLPHLPRLSLFSSPPTPSPSPSSSTARRRIWGKSRRGGGRTGRRPTD